MVSHRRSWSHGPIHCGGVSCQSVLSYQCPRPHCDIDRAVKLHWLHTPAWCYPEEFLLLLLLVWIYWPGYQTREQPKLPGLQPHTSHYERNGPIIQNWIFFFLTYLFCCCWLTNWHTKYERKKSFCALGCISLWRCTQINHQEFDYHHLSALSQISFFVLMCAGPSPCKASTEQLANHKGLLCSEAEPWMKQGEEEQAKKVWEECFFFSFWKLGVFLIKQNLFSVGKGRREKKKQWLFTFSTFVFQKWLAPNAQSSFDVNTPEVLWLLLELLNELKSD